MDKPRLRSMAVILNLLLVCLGFGANWQVAYQTDFSSDPGWVTDQPGKYYWDAASQTYHVRSENKAPALGLNRYFYKLLAEPVGSFVLQWDVKITYEDWSCGLAFGLWDNTFSDLSLPGGQTIYFVSGIGDGGRVLCLVVKGPNGQVNANSPFGVYSLNQWYTIVLTYDAVANTVDCKVTIRDTGATVWTANTLSVPGGSFTTDLRYLGGTRRTGYNGTYPGLSQWAVAEGNIDNVVLSVIDHDVKPPQVTAAIDKVSANSACIFITVNNDGGEECTTRLRYKPAGGNYSYTGWLGTLSTGESGTICLYNLTQGATYYCNAQGKNSAGEGDWSNEVSFVPTTEGWSFVQITDPHIGYTDDEEGDAREWLDQTVCQIKKIKPDFVLVTGDIVESACYAPLVCRKERYDAFKESMRALEEDGIPYYVVPGNHDHLWCLSWHCYEENMGHFSDWAFTHEGMLFIGLNSGWGVIDRTGSGLTDDQYAFLKGIEVLTPEGDMPKVIYMHHPAEDYWPPDGSIEHKDGKVNGKTIRLRDWCYENKVRLVLAGHTHNNHVSDWDGNEEVVDYGKPVLVQTRSCGKDAPRSLRVIKVKGGYAYPQEETTISKQSCTEVELCSPGNVHIFDSAGRHVGIGAGGEVEYGIPNSVYHAHYAEETDDGEENVLPERIIVFDPCDKYMYEVVGKEEGTYDLLISWVKGGNEIEVEGQDIPILPGSVHDYIIDWEALANGQEGVTVYVDKDGDKNVDLTITAHKTITAADFVEVATKLATNVGKTNARLWGRLNDEGGGGCWCRFSYFKEGQGLGYVKSTPWIQGLRAGEVFGQVVTGLLPGTKYWFWAEAMEPRHWQQTEWGYGLSECFTTLKGLVEVRAPNGGENWFAGTTQTVQWGADPAVSQIVLEYSVDNGTTWYDLAVLVHTEENKKYPWVVPDADSTQCLIRVSDAKDPSVADVSDGVFCITRCLVPRVVGMFVEDAQAALAAAGLTVGTVKEQYATWPTCGTVMHQVVPEGTALPAGSPVDFVVAGGAFGAGGPTMGTQAATDVGSGGAKLWGKVLDDDGEWCRYRFHYWPDLRQVRVIQMTAWKGYAKKGQSFSEVITGLKPGTKYYFWVQGMNSTGQSESGELLTFITAP